MSGMAGWWSDASLYLALSRVQFSGAVQVLLTRCNRVFYTCLMSVPRYLLKTGQDYFWIGKHKAVRVESIGTKYAVILTEEGSRFKTAFGNLDFLPHGTKFEPTVELADSKKLKVGVPVRFKSGALKSADKSLYVIISKRGEVYKLVKLGGGNQYSNVSAAHLELVDLTINTEE